MMPGWRWTGVWSLSTNNYRRIGKTSVQQPQRKVTKNACRSDKKRHSITSWALRSAVFRALIHPLEAEHGFVVFQQNLRRQILPREIILIRARSHFPQFLPTLAQSFLNGLHSFSPLLIDTTALEEILRKKFQESHAVLARFSLQILTLEFLLESADQDHVVGLRSPGTGQLLAIALWDGGRSTVQAIARPPAGRGPNSRRIKWWSLKNQPIPPKMQSRR